MKRKDLYINGRFLTKPLTGISRYAYELTCELVRSGVKVTIICPKQDIRPEYDVKGLNIVKFGFGRSHIWEQISLPLFFINRKDFMLVCFSGLGPIIIFNKIITIHDLAFLENPSWFSKTYVLIYKLLTPLSVKTSKRILTVSYFSKQEIINKLGVKEDSISVIYNAVNISQEEQGDILKKVPGKYVLAVSSIDPRKNYARLTQALSLLPNCNLVVVGGVSHIFNHVKMSQSLNNVYSLGRVTDEELTTLYKNATAFIYPSLYEGFGIPPIEAMVYGCPVVVSDISVLHEVCGDAALYVDPYNINEIAKAIERVENDVNLRLDLKEKGYKNIRRYSWHNSSVVLKEILEQFI